MSDADRRMARCAFWIGCQSRFLRMADKAFARVDLSPGNAAAAEYVRLVDLVAFCEERIRRV